MVVVKGGREVMLMIPQVLGLLLPSPLLRPPPNPPLLNSSSKYKPNREIGIDLTGEGRLPPPPLYRRTRSSMFCFSGYLTYNFRCVFYLCLPSTIGVISRLACHPLLA